MRPGTLKAWTPAQADMQGSEADSLEMIGKMAPAWSTQGWINADSAEIKQFRGKVVLLRFLNDAASSAKTLNELFHTYRQQGLAMVGIYAPTPFPARTSLEHVRDLVNSQGFEFPVGLDSRWETLNGYWVQRADADLTATTFLIDRQGIVRYIQPDGIYEKNSTNRAVRKEYVKLEKEIETLLKSDEPALGGAGKDLKSTRFLENFRSRERS